MRRNKQLTGMPEPSYQNEKTQSHLSSQEIVSWERVKMGNTLARKKRVRVRASSRKNELLAERRRGVMVGQARKVFLAEKAESMSE